MRIPLTCPPHINGLLHQQRMEYIHPYSSSASSAIGAIGTKSLSSVHRELRDTMMNWEALFEALTLPVDVSKWSKKAQKDREEIIRQLAVARPESIRQLKLRRKLNALYTKHRNAAYATDDDFCHNFEFNDDLHCRSSSSSSTLPPLMDTVVEKQVVLGRQRILTPYFKCNKTFLTMNSKFWDVQYNLNDLFIHCAVTAFQPAEDMPNKFPIRIVLSERMFDETDDQLVVVRPKGRMTVTHREVCQLITTYGMHLYQSLEVKNIFFACRAGTKHDPQRFARIDVDVI